MKTTQTKLLLIVAFATLAGCASRSTPEWDAHFGEAVNMAKAQQTINPNASQNRDPVKGIDGRAARESIERYEASFTKPPPPANVFSIGVSGGGGQ